MRSAPGRRSSAALRLGLGVALAAILASTPSHASDWHLAVEGVTDFPLDVGGQVTLELPLRFRLSASVGGMPAGYVDVWNALAVVAGGYDDAMAELVGSALEDSLVLRVHAGWRPVEDAGFYFELGYGLAALGGGVSTGALVEAVTGDPLPAEALFKSGHGFSVDSELHMVDVELGWLFQLGGGWTLRTAIGWAVTLEARSKISPQFDPLLPTVVDDFTSEAEERLERAFLSWVHPPTFSLAFGYLFL